MKFTILHTEESWGWGGQEIRILRESLGMKSRGHKVIIAAHPKSRLLFNAKKEGLKTLPIEFKKNNFLRVVLFFKKLIEEENVDIVNTHSSKDSWMVLPAARRADNKPLVLRTRHLSTAIHRGILNRFLYNYLPHFIITTGKAIKRQMVKVNGFNADKIRSIPTGVDVNVFNPDKVYVNVRKELSLPEDVPLVGTVSVLRSWKGHIHFINSIPEVINKEPRVRFVIVGEGPYRPSIEKAVDKVKVRSYVRFLGHREDIPAIMSSLDILVHPSYANEGIPQSLLQAMAMRKPVVVSALAPLREVVKDGITGLVAPIADPEAIASRVLSLLKNKEQANRIGENARRLAKKEYSFPGMIANLESLYERRA